MDFSPILQNIARHITLNEEESAFFTSLLSYREVKRKELLLHQGQVCNRISFVIDGALRAYYVDKDLEEHIIMFAISDWWITDIYSFTTHHPAVMQIDALEESRIFQLQHSHLDKLFIQIPKFEKFFRIIMQNSYVREQLRSIQNLSISAEERYVNFTAKYPAFAQRIPQKQIASYLGMTPEFLSKVRNKLTKGNS